MDSTLIKLLLGNGPKDREDKEVMLLHNARVDVSKFIVEAKRELKKWK